MNKRANLDSPVLGVGIFIIGVALIVAGIAISTGLSAFSNNSNATALLTNSQTMFVNMGNSGFLFITLALIIFNILAAFFLPTHPIFVIIDIIFLPISVWVASIISNTWTSTMSSLAVTYGYTMLNTVMTNLVLVIVCVDILSAVVSYAIIKNNYG